MAGKLSPKAQLKLSALRQMEDRVHHVHGLVEKFATTKNQAQAERMAQPMKRAFGRLKLDLMGAGLDSMSQLAGAMEIAAGRGGSLRNKARILREGVGSLRFQVEQAQRKVVSEDEAEQRKAAAAERHRQEAEEQSEQRPDS